MVRERATSAERRGRQSLPTSGWSRCFSTCWRPSAAPAKTRLPLTAATLPISPSYLGGRGGSVATATTDDMRAYLGDLARRGMQPTTVARRLSAIRQLYRFLYAEGQRKDDPAAVLEGPKRARALPKTLTLAEVDRLLRVAGQTDPRGAAGGAAARGAARLSGRASLRHRACASPNLWRCRLRRRAATPGSSSCAARATKSASCRSTTPPSARWPTIWRLLPKRAAERRQRRIEMAVPFVRRHRPSHPPAFRPRAQGACGRRRACARRS